MDLIVSLNMYNTDLGNLLTNPEVLERFKQLSTCDSLGCFCAPESMCHTDIIRNYLKVLGLKAPPRQCVKVKYLRKTGYDNLEEWISNPKNILCTRRGRVFIGKKDNQKVYHYPQSEWHNPHKVK
jgi:hypothetical protein